MKILLFFASLLAFVNSHAQVAEAYGSIAIDPLRNVELLPYTSLQYSSYTPIGVTFGGAINFINLAPITVGVDASDTVASHGANIWLAGLRITAKPSHLGIKPSFKLSVGEAHLHTPQTYSTTYLNPIPYNFYVYNAALGIARPIDRILDIRFEVGDGRTLGAGSANPMNLLTLDAGLVVHF